MKKVLIISAIANDSQFDRSRTVMFARALHKTGRYKIDFATYESSLLPSFVDKIYFIKNKNYKARVYTLLSKIKQFRAKNNLLKAKLIDHNDLYHHTLFTSSSLIKSLIEYLFDFYIDPLSTKLDKMPNIKDYEFVFSSYSPFINHVIANRLKNISHNTLFIYDFRDPVVQSSTHSLLRKSINRKVSKLIKPEDIVTSVTADCFIQLNIEHENKYILSNGYEKITFPKSEKKIFEELDFSNKKLSVLFAGSLYEGRSDLAPILLAMEKFASENRTVLNNIQFIYIGNNKSFFDSYYSLNWTFEVKSFDYISREKLFYLYNLVDLIVISSWKYKNYPGEGEPSSKIYELLTLKKPLVALINKTDINLKTDLASLMKVYGHENVFEFSNSVEKMAAIKEIELLLSRLYHGDEDYNLVESNEYDWNKLCTDFLVYLSTMAK